MNTFTDLIERLNITLEYSERGSLTFIVGDKNAQHIILDPIKQQLKDEHLSIFDISTSEIGLLEHLKGLDSERVNILIIGLDRLKPEQRKKILRDINFHREILREAEKNLVFLVDQSSLNEFAQLALDLWSIRSGVFNIPRQASFSPSGLTRIIGKDQIPVGAGFLIDEHRIITCAHIVANSLGLEGIPTKPPKNRLTVEFPFIEPTKLISARIIAWVLKDDVAVLELIGKSPTDAEAMGLIDQPNIQGHAFRVLGFPTNFPHGVWASGSLDTDTEGRLLLEYSSTTGTTIQPGFSGGPIWDEKLQGVVGMIQQAEIRPGVQVGLGLPINRIADSYKPLYSLIPKHFSLTRQRYRDHLQSNYQALDLKGILQPDSAPPELRLVDVYVPLLARPEMPVGETWERRLAGRIIDTDQFAEIGHGKGSTRQVRIEDELKKHSRVVILGDPGSGKTTLLKYLALTATEKSNEILPILIPVSAFAAFQNDKQTSLYEFLSEYYKDQNSTLSNLESLFENVISKGKALIMLDGLDEILSQRYRLVQEIEKLAREVVRQGCKIIVTSRIIGYRDAPLSSSDWALYTLLDFDRNSINAFVQRWCLALEKSMLGDTPEAKSVAEREYKELIAAIDSNPGVASLASNPLLLTILALIKRQREYLPSRRVQLYDLYLETLTSTWNLSSSLYKRPMTPSLGYLEIIKVLAPLALWIHEESSSFGLVSEESLIEWLTGLYQGEDWGLNQDEAETTAYEFLDSVHRYSNLLVQRGPGEYGFIHLAFEEALAARGIVQLGAADLNKSLSFIQKHISDPAWREVILLAIGTWGIVQAQPRVAGEMVRRILEMSLDGADKGANVLIAGQCLEDIGERGISRAVASEVQQSLLDTNHDRALSPIIQRDAGFILGRSNWLPEDLDDLVIIHRGKFLFGKEKVLKIIEHNYSIGKYPVTNLQYKRFIDAGGYNNEKYWDSNGWQWKTKNKVMQPSLWEHSEWNNPLAPVIGVSWYEASAYCRWLGERNQKVVSLPSAEEWERAARGKEGHLYPWGDTLYDDRINSANFWKDYSLKASTTIISQFPSGCSSEGVCDLCGNVWEWTLSKSQNAQIIYGGSWKDKDRDINGYKFSLVSSGISKNFIGFRIVSKLQKTNST